MKINKIAMLSVIIATLAISGCQTTRINAMTGEEETNDTTSGLLIGCLGGAVVGALINKGKGAAIGCAGGAVVGGAVGNKLDKQEEMLRAELRNSGVRIKRYDDRIELLLDGDISFSTGSTQVSNGTITTLKSVVKVMKDFKDTTISVLGHTDSKGSVQYNQNLSEARAKSVQSILNRYGLPRNRTTSEGYGEMSPLCDNATSQGRACNRRVELIIMNAS